MITVSLACGHRVRWEDGQPRPRCEACHESRIVHVSAPPPRFRGAVGGPLAGEPQRGTPHRERLVQAAPLVPDTAEDDEG